MERYPVEDLLDDPNLLAKELYDLARAIDGRFHNAKAQFVQSLPATFVDDDGSVYTYSLEARRMYDAHHRSKEYVYVYDLTEIHTQEIDGVVPWLAEAVDEQLMAIEKHDDDRWRHHLIRECQVVKQGHFTDIGFTVRECITFGGFVVWEMPAKVIDGALTTEQKKEFKRIVRKTGQIAEEAAIQELIQQEHARHIGRALRFIRGDDEDGLYGLPLAA